ncbi:MAG TPA: helix-turn-helix domain-containing protein [Ramlibacter sp.]|nr:helix-turn-helix domain-containing protein [Ramlibacter sp.]
MQAAKVLSIHSLERGLKVLKVIQAGAGVSLRDLHQASGVPKASLLRILKTLGEQECVGRTADGRYFAVGGGAAQAPDTQATALAVSAQATLEALGAQLPWPSDLGVPDGTRMRVVASNRAAYGRGWRRSVVGAQVDLLDSALGRTYLAFCRPEERLELTEQVLGAEPARRRRREAWEGEIELARTRGFGSRDALYAGPDSHHDDRLSAIAVPVLSNGLAVGCLSCVWDTARATRTEVIESCLAHLVRAACALG